ncbi:uncharacterized protein ARB_01255 [Trichophyton benhamiae CBS 112371]|uniref:Uncharacterized protein n=1 Tax=Arthroderma benhamiae (strain ATCC MYA-4681 / CBS 112371) TaxID=663331 RepID=D4AYI6_ARTBC|nr:uncharacterized protein ARB_01255 [Trichophyton benhamiae CBS 112371]EFE32002.1 hypothetical protein ARB_01255 [Trichophyton benhamiae CBS 112371]
MERDDSHTTAVDVGVAVVAGALVVRLAEQAKRNEEKLSFFLFERRDARESESERGTEREKREEREKEQEKKKKRGRREVEEAKLKSRRTKKKVAVLAQKGKKAKRDAR